MVGPGASCCLGPDFLFPPSAFRGKVIGDFDRDFPNKCL